MTMQEIEVLAAQLAEARDRLAAAIAAAPELFAERRSVTLHGVKTGPQEHHGGLSWEDDATLVARIRTRLPEQFAALVEVTERPRKEALAELDLATLQDLGVAVKRPAGSVTVRFVEADNQLDLFAQENREAA